MFTIRLLRSETEGYYSVACAEYEVNEFPEYMELRVVLKDEVKTFTVGDREYYDVAYVTNLNGKTIDKIRQKDNS
jgi:hypothetical protein